jgi:hypothetical protein
MKLSVTRKSLEHSFNNIFENRREETKTVYCEESIEGKRQKDRTGNNFHPYN